MGYGWGVTIFLIALCVFYVVGAGFFWRRNFGWDRGYAALMLMFATVVGLHTAGFLR